MTEQEKTELTKVELAGEKLVGLCESLQTSQECAMHKLDEMIEALKQKKAIEHKILLCHRRMVKSARLGNAMDVRSALMEAHRWRRHLSPL